MVGTATHDQLVAELTGGLAPSEADLPRFGGSDRLRPDGRPRPEFRAELRRIPNIANLAHVVVSLAYPFLVVWAAVTVSHPLSWVLAFCAMGVWYQRALTLHHESAHRLLFSNRTANDWLGEKLLGLLAFGDGGPAYRIVHTQHHRDEFGEREPDFMLYARYPVAADSMRRKLMRDALGVSGYKLLKPALVGLFVKGRRIRALRLFGGQLLVFAVFAAFGHPWLYVLLWWLPWMTFWQVANRLRALAEHGGMTRSADRRRTSNNIRQGFLSRYVFLPHSVGFHLAHHVDSGIPMSKLPKYHRALVEDGYITEAITYPSYRAFWRTLVAPGDSSA